MGFSWSYGKAIINISISHGKYNYFSFRRLNDKHKTKGIIVFIGHCFIEGFLPECIFLLNNDVYISTQQPIYPECQLAFNKSTVTERYVNQLLW